MAIRFPRVLIACGLPTILAIVSYYWLRKRRKAVVLSSSPHHLPNSQSPSVDKQSEEESLISADSHYSPKQVNQEVFYSKPAQPLSRNNSTKVTADYDMQLKENNNCGPHKETSGGRDTATSGQLLADSRNTRTDQMASNHTNNTSSVKRHQSCDNSSNECNGNESPLNQMLSSKCSVEDTIVVKLSNFSLNDNINDKLIEKRNTINKESKCDKPIDESIIDGCGLTGAQHKSELKSELNSEPQPAITTTVNSHTDNIECKDSTSINNDLNNANDSIEDHLCENNNNETNDCQHIQVFDSTQLMAKQKESSQHLTLDIGGDGLIMSQTNSVDNASSVCSSSASCLMTNGYDTGDMYHNYPDSVSNGVYSPPHSAFSDVHSEGSSDSAKGGSDIVRATPIDSQTLNPLNERVIYQFEIPQYLCGRLIGSGGRFVTQIKRVTNTSVVINKHIASSDMKICTLTGTKPEIREALRMIRSRFPAADYPNVTLQQINLLNASQMCPMPVQTVQLQLPSGISCDVILSSMVSSGHFFLQQPTHPTYPSLSRLDHHMIQTYSQQNTPRLPTIHSGMICAVPIMGGWYRAVITKVYETEECDVMFVDYGGYSRLPVSSLRQIRYDFMSLPFQASECYLANVEPIDPELGWTAEANALFEELAQGQILQAFIVGYSENGIPLVNLFKIQGISNVFINQELVNQSHAQWVDTSA